MNNEQEPESMNKILAYCLPFYTLKFQDKLFSIKWNPILYRVLFL